MSGNAAPEGLDDANRMMKLSLESSRNFSLGWSRRGDPHGML